MHLKFTLATFLIAVPVALATPQAPLGVELADCINLSLTNCHIDLEWTGNFLCVCSNDEDNEPSLADFYTGTNYTGFEYQACGQYGTCYDLPEYWDQESNSMISGWDGDDPLICCVYTGQECNTDKYAWTEVPANVSQFEGVYKYGVRSFQCSPWLDEWSQCGDSAPTPPTPPLPSSPAWQDPTTWQNQPAQQSPPAYS